MALSDKALATRERILAAATELFYLNGYHATGLDKVIHQAEITKGNFYYHFKSKEALAVATLEWQFSLLSKDIKARVFAQKLQPLDTLFLLFDYMVGRQKEQYHEGQICGCYFGNFALEFSTASSEVREAVNTVFSNYRALIESLLVRAIKAGQIAKTLDAATLATVILGQIEGAILLDKAQQKTDTFAISIQFIKQYLLNSEDRE